MVVLEHGTNGPRVLRHVEEGLNRDRVTATTLLPRLAVMIVLGRRVVFNSVTLNCARLTVVSVTGHRGQFVLLSVEEVKKRDLKHVFTLHRVAIRNERKV